MHGLRIGHRMTLATVFILSASIAHADLLTPNSISSPPGTVGSSNLTPVYPGNLVTSQYTGLGMNFPSGTAITSLNGVNVWAPTQLLMSPFGQQSGSPAAEINYGGTWGGASFVLPGTTTPAVASSLSVEIVGNQNVSIFPHYVPNSGVAIPDWIMMSPQPNGGTLYTFPAGPGITSFSIEAPVNGPPGNPAWGVGEVSITFAHIASPTPEPSSLVLAGLGALGLAVRYGRRRKRSMAL